MRLLELLNFRIYSAVVFVLSIDSGAVKYLIS